MLSEQVGLILRRAVDADRPISEFGLDSLGNLELRTHIESEVKIRVTTTDITTIRGLADHLYDELTSKGDIATPS
jgi:polyketide synthase 5